MRIIPSPRTGRWAVWELAPSGGEELIARFRLRWVARVAAERARRYPLTRFRSRSAAAGWRPVRARVSAAFVGVRLAELRHAAGMTQVDLAKKVGVSRATIANIEVGQSDPSLSVFAALVWALNADASALLRQPACSACGDRPPPGFACVTCEATTPPAVAAGAPEVPSKDQKRIEEDR